MKVEKVEKVEEVEATAKTGLSVMCACESVYVACGSLNPLNFSTSSTIFQLNKIHINNILVAVRKLAMFLASKLAV
ncbi:hypothetical protein Halhy_2131 [Haliscomenobacter hydrossis DSM 1100]|uniref:Uncharacterized protein n=1 Tax=Haliscomenobacter hydrossis (strain ATCC 27775 / DSM 1100 / LMG 10767 / O) TaxID=760192 RepID=F4KRR2_HALH1|nr:hypothetical protein Halhy_2131 [Haliscomenobacter hydrossis DSM 1100]